MFDFGCADANYEREKMKTILINADFESLIIFVSAFLDPSVKRAILELTQ